MKLKAYMVGRMYIIKTKTEEHKAKIAIIGTAK